MDKFSYGLGMGIGQNLLSMSVKNLDVDDFVKGLKDVLAGAKTDMSHTEAQQVVNDHFRKLAEEAYEQNKAAGEAFLAANAKKEGVVVLPSGLQYEVLAEGNGKKPSATDRVQCHYEGTLIDGTIFDSNYRGELNPEYETPVEIALDECVWGFSTAMQEMVQGDIWDVYIPANLGYADSYGVVKAASTLIFTLNLVESFHVGDKE